MRQMAVALGFGIAALAPPQASAAFVDDYAALLAEARVADAAALAETEMAAGPGTAALALGAARFIGAVEALIQGLHRQGLTQEISNAPLAMAGLPFLRLPAPENPAPDTVSYAALRGLLAEFAADLEVTRAALREVPADAATQLPLDLAVVRLDLDSDGAADASLVDLIARLGSPAGALPTAPERFSVDFDAADAAWLTAYAHLLGALAEILLAHDWEASFDATFAALFPTSFPHDTPIRRQAAERRAAFAALGPLPAPPSCERYAFDSELEIMDVVPACDALWSEYEADPAVAQGQMFAAEGMNASIADLVAFVHLFSWPVTEPERMEAALAHLEGMVAASREMWTRIEAETDDRAEWIPAPGQSGVIAGLPIDEAMIAAWRGALDEIDAVIAGRLLVPHWRFEEGVNLRRMFLEPRRLDPVLILQGSAVERYLEDGPVAGPEAWDALGRAFGGRFLPYAVWLN